MRIRGDRIYDEYGEMVGRIRGENRIVDQYGNEVARIRGGARVVGQYGEEQGRIRRDRIDDAYGQPLDPGALFDR